ncbi:MAG: exodeoxyribonuclease VII small subunit [Paludibacteraceae bacterium]|nr:exodeoxyribonuclease VII small subunit [Paludibacteraceae bacterium]MBP6285233.1 exodeoxyribonuclease VII small subunit [Paludibacteraceae bacterium]
MKKEKNTSYDEAYEKLETILHKIEGNELSVDELLEHIKEATALIDFCKNRLKTIDEEVSKLME